MYNSQLKLYQGLCFQSVLLFYWKIYCAIFRPTHFQDLASSRVLESLFLEWADDVYWGKEGLITMRLVRRVVCPNFDTLT